MRRVTKAVIPAAGLGTRFLPATKSTPKEMLPVVDKPAIQYVVEEAVAAGLTDVLLITGRGKRPLEDHFDRAYELEQALEARGDRERLARVRESSEMANVHYVRQGDPRGLGHAVLCARQHVGDEPFAVLLGDDIIDARAPLLQHMLGVLDERGGSVVALMRVPRETIGAYGCAVTDGDDTQADGVVNIVDLVEKPDPAEAPSDLAVIGRYVLAPEIFDVLAKTEPGRSGEIQLTDALRTVARTGEGPVSGVIFTGHRYDTGDRLGYLEAVVRLACEREDLGPDFRRWLAKFVAEHPSA